MRREAACWILAAGLLGCRAAAAFEAAASDAGAAADPAGVDAPSLEERWLGEPFRDLELDDLDAATVRLGELRDSVVVLNFWFIACPPCIAEIPKLNAVVERFADRDVEFFAITFDEEPDLCDFLVDHPFRYRVASVTRDLLEEIGVEEYPSHLVIDRTGRVREVITGYDSGTRIAAAVEQALAGR